MLTAILLGLFHGVNPAMGWLFAVFLAINRKQRAELGRSLLPIALGHGLSVALVVALVAGARSVLPIEPVRYGSAAVVLAVGLWRLLRWYRHPASPGGLNVRYRDLVLWSFLGATAHGSGLMLTPLVLGLPGGGEAAAVVVVHTVTMLLVMFGVAVVVHDRLWLGVLRRYWFNFDLLWAVGLLVAGGLLLAGAMGHGHA